MIGPPCMRNSSNTSLISVISWSALCWALLKFRQDWFDVFCCVYVALHMFCFVMCFPDVSWSNSKQQHSSLCSGQRSDRKLLEWTLECEVWGSTSPHLRVSLLLAASTVSHQSHRFPFFLPPSIRATLHATLFLIFSFFSSCYHQHSCCSTVRNSSFLVALAHASVSVSLKKKKPLCPTDPQLLGVEGTGPTLCNRIMWWECCFSEPGEEWRTCVCVCENGSSNYLTSPLATVLNLVQDD